MEGVENDGKSAGELGVITEEDHDPREALQAESLAEEGLTQSALLQARANFERLVAAVGASLSGTLGYEVTAEAAGIEYDSYGDFLRSSPIASFVASIGNEEQRGRLVLEFDPELAVILLEGLLGARPSGKGGLQRELTELERGIVSFAAELVTAELPRAWPALSVSGSECACVSDRECLSHLLRADDGMLVFRGLVSLERAQGEFRLAVPAFRLRGSDSEHPLDLQERTQAGAPTKLEARGVLATVPVRLQVDLQGGRIEARRLLALKAGSVLCFSRAADEPLECSVNGKLKYRGHLVASGGKRGVKIERHVNAGSF